MTGRTCRGLVVRGIFVVGAATLLVASLPIYRPRKSWRWKLTKGQRLTVALQQDTTTETIIRKESLRLSVERQIELDWIVREVDDKGVARIEQSFSRLRLKMQNPRSPSIEYDSASTVAPQGAAADLAKSLAPLLKLKFLVVMDDRGRVQDVTLPTDAEVSVGKLPTPMKDLFSRQGLRQTMQQAAQALPEKGVSKSDRWSGEVRTKTRFGELISNSDYSFLGNVEHDGKQVAKIEVETKVKLAPKASTSPAGFRLKQQLQKGAIYFDTLNGYLAESQSDQTLITESRRKDLVMETRSKTSMRMNVTVLK